MGYIFSELNGLSGTLKYIRMHGRGNRRIRKGNRWLTRTSRTVLEQDPKEQQNAMTVSDLLKSQK